MERKKCKGTQLSVFKGREAKLNRAILENMANRESQTVYDIHRHLIMQRRLRNLRYTSVNKRVKALETSGFAKKVEVRKTKAGFEAAMYGVNGRGYLALLINSIDLDNLVKVIDESAAFTILLALINTWFSLVQVKDKTYGNNNRSNNP
jgi:hypothetical protein